MSANSDTCWLIVEPAPKGDGRLEALVPALAQLGIDPYGARQRLVGCGPALLSRGAPESLETAASLLREHRFSCWTIHPIRPLFHPARILSLDARPEVLVFYCRDRSVSFPRGSVVLAVLADLSGAVVEKSLKRLLARNAYQGGGILAPPSDEEIRLAILRGSPVLDLYLLSPGGPPSAAVRVFPGKYDPKGLGEKATLSGAGNLQALIEIVRGYAGDFALETAFGLASLPGCQPSRGEPGGDMHKESLVALTRFGWLMADLYAAGRRPGASSSVESLADGDHGELAQSSRSADILPLPPAGGEKDPFGRSWLGVLGGAAGTLLVPLLWMDWGVLHFVWRFGAGTGALPAFFSVLLFLAGLQFLGWKRRIENTPTSRVRSLAMGMVEVHGRALRRYSLVSPMTQMACVWYRLQRYRRDRSGWCLKNTVSSGAVPFILDDGTGQVTVDPQGAVMRPRTRQEGYGEGGGSLFESSGFSGPDEKWVEEVIFEGSSVYVLGFARPAVRGSSLRERTAEALRHLKGDPEAMRRIDADGDGRISPAEWDAARAEVEAQSVRATLAHPERKDAGGEAVIGKGRGLPFIIAEAESPLRVARGYGVAVPLLLGGGFLLAALATFLFFSRT